MKLFLQRGQQQPSPGRQLVAPGKVISVSGVFLWSHVKGLLSNSYFVVCLKLVFVLPIFPMLWELPNPPLGVLQKGIRAVLQTLVMSFRRGRMGANNKPFQACVTRFFV